MSVEVSGGSALLRRLLGLCVAAGLLLAVVPTVIHGVVTHQELQARAQVHAQGLAAAIGQLAVRQPRLWRYNVGKVASAAWHHPGRAELASLVVVDCAGGEVFKSAFTAAASHRSRGASRAGPTGRAAIIAFGRTVGFVGASVDGAHRFRQLVSVGVFSTLLGLLLALGLYLLPARRIAQSAQEGHLRRLAERVLAGEEAQRKRIAADLHDGLGQHLSAALVGLELGRIDSAQASTRDALEELRHAVFHLRPRELDEGGPVAAMEAAVRRFEGRTGITAAFRREGDGEVHDTVGIALLRIGQEALGNVARHAKATEVGVVLVVGAESTRLRVADDGEGIGTDATQGYGLQGMAERAERLGGSVTVTSDAEGTTVEATIPTDRWTRGAGE